MRKYQVSKREDDILYVLWRAGRPLLASEIADDELKLTTVHTTLKRMLKKGLVQVVDFAKSGNVFGRCYEPSMSMVDYERDKFSNNFAKNAEREVTIASMVEAILDEENEETVRQELDGLEQIIKEKRERIRKEREREAMEKG